MRAVFLAILLVVTLLVSCTAALTSHRALDYRESAAERYPKCEQSNAK